ncbi:GNAT family N-acetyltransferase [Paenibacillus paeoniae]|uniref:GNAT family N-acetyltransferase n=1 Tax=Paenibacillus paeoniae TaxID=2292705 RepID=A0A371PH80_9BACL|nr:GNAT family N-acetyltransferase [Paenibacillus paeoniae]REK75596.1 GNAT family N-acetyltransferase [Paenibacillus paeoniae]
MELAFNRIETDQQFKEVADMASEIWNEYYLSLISQEQIDYMLDKFQSVAAIADQIIHQGYQYYFVTANEENVGYIAVQLQQDKLFLSKFYMLKQHRGKGYANHAMDYIIGLGKEHGLKSLCLTVNKGNEGSVAVYKKKGFIIAREEIASIGQGYVMDDFIMEKAILS